MPTPWRPLRARSRARVCAICFHPLRIKSGACRTCTLGCIGPVAAGCLFQIDFRLVQSRASKLTWQRGGNRRSEKAKADQTNIVSLKHGNSRDYTLARLDRDGHTELAADVREGKVSANAAAEI